jgi:cytochrome oxidase assembly protein ShyY1
VYRFLLTRQWVILTLVGLLLMPAMVRLGIWQMHRHESEDANNARMAHALAAASVPLESLTRPGATVPAADDFRTVTVRGHYDPAHQVVVRHRTSADDSTIGYYLVTPLILTDGRAVLVNRGWIPAQDDVTTFPPVPATPTGEVTITGRLRQDETTAGTGIQNKTGLPPRQVMLINSRLLAHSVPEPMLGGYVELTRTSPAPGKGQPQPVPAPTPGQTDGGYNPPHLAYAWQWWLFVAMVPVGWVILVRREHREQVARRDKARAAAAGDGPPHEAPDGSATGPAAGAPAHAAAVDAPSGAAGTP